jgi:hypothetical protein
VSNTCGTTGRVIYAEKKVAQRAALRGWVRGGRKLALTARPCEHSTSTHYHLVPVDEELIRVNLDVMDEGALARVVNATNDLSTPKTVGIRRYPPGFEFVVEDYVPADVARDGVAFYWGSAGGGGNNVCVVAADVEQVKTAEEMAMRTLPEAKDLLDFIASALLTDRDGIRIDEVERSGGVIEAFGKTEEGLTFGFSFPVTEVSIWRTDD